MLCVNSIGGDNFGLRVKYCSNNFSKLAYFVREQGEKAKRIGK